MLERHCNVRREANRSSGCSAAMCQRAGLPRARTQRIICSALKANDPSILLFSSTHSAPSLHLSFLLF